MNVWVCLQGIRFVVDSCFVKLNFFDVRSGVDALVVCPVSRAAATQRAGSHFILEFISPAIIYIDEQNLCMMCHSGRAGRTENGKCFRLAPESFFHSDSIKGALTL